MLRILFLGLAGLSLVKALDREVPNRPYVVSDPLGHCYAKAIPTQKYGYEGSTHVYAVRAGADSLLHSFSWYSPRAFLSCDPLLRNFYLTRMGAWPRGEAASEEDLAFAFYHNGALLQRYSTLAIAERADNVRRSISHYEVIDSVQAHQRNQKYGSVFRVYTVDRRALTFNPRSGVLVAE